MQASLCLGSSSGEAELAAGHMIVELRGRSGLEIDLAETEAWKCREEHKTEKTGMNELEGTPALHSLLK